jgi:hypothetical protein
LKGKVATKPPKPGPIACVEGKEIAMRAADDFAAIRARMEELQRERLGRREPEQRTAPADKLIIGASDPKTVEAMKARINERNRVWMAQR